MRSVPRDRVSRKIMARDFFDPTPNNRTLSSNPVSTAIQTQDSTRSNFQRQLALIVLPFFRIFPFENHRAIIPAGDLDLLGRFTQHAVHQIREGLHGGIFRPNPIIVDGFLANFQGFLNY